MKGLVERFIAESAELEQSAEWQDFMDKYNAVARRSQPTKNSKELTILQLLDRIVGILKIYRAEKLDLENAIDVAGEYIEPLCEKLDLSETQVLFFAILLDGNLFVRNGIERIALNLRCGNIKILMQYDEIATLQERGYIVYDSKTYGFRVPEYVTDALKKNEAYAPRTITNIGFDELLINVSEYMKQCEMSQLSSEELFDKIEQIMTQNPELPFVKGVISLLGIDSTPFDKTILIYFCSKFFKMEFCGGGSCVVSISAILRTIRDHKYCLRLREQIASLLKSGVIERTKDFRGKEEKGTFLLSRKAHRVLFPEIEFQFD